MFRKALLALALLFAAAPALAQNTTCSDRPTSDSSNACANTRFVQTHVSNVVIPISSYGAKCDNATDDTTSIQNAWNAAAAVGTNVWLGGVGVGICRFTTLTMPTPTGTGKASFLTGPGSGAVQLSTNVTGTTCAITATATYGVNGYIEGAFTGFELIQRNHTQTGYGFCVTGFTKGTWNDVKFSWFYRGFSGIDTTSISIINSTFLDNQIGVYGIAGTSSGPNDWNISYNKFQSNGKNAISLTRPNLANIAFNELQSNGYNFGQAPTGTIDLIGPAGFASSTIANVLNNYFEGNVGTAEVRVDQSAIADISGIYNVFNNTFIRTDSGVSGLAAGVLILNSGPGTSKSTVNVGGNNFYDDTGVSAGFLWISAGGPGGPNYLFNCTTSNQVNIAVEMPTVCRNNTANTVPMVDASAQYIGYGTQLQLTALINPATATLSGAVPAWPNDTTKFFRGDGTYAVPTAGSISGGVALTKANDTNVTLTLGGSPTTALLQATSITVGWAGTLAAARLNANVVQAITNDTNITGSIAAQNLTLAWAGTLANARLAPMTGNTIKGNGTAGSASPTDLAIPSCSSASSALIWNLSVGFGCNTSITSNIAANITITDDSATNATMYPLWVTTTSGNLPVKISSTKMTFNPATAALTIGGNMSANAFNNVTIPNPGATASFTLGSGKAVVINNALTFSGTDSTTQTFPTTSATLARTDAGQTFTGANIFSTSISSPLHYGGSAAGSTALVNGTSNGSPSSAFLNLQSNGQFVSIGNTAPKAPLDLNVNLSSSPALVVSTSQQRWQAADSSNGGTEWVSYGAATQNVLTGAVAGGTSASPTGTPTGRSMFNLRGYGWNATSWQIGGIITIRSGDIATWSGTNQGTQIDFYTTPNSTTSLALAAQFFPSGGLGVGSAATDPGVNKISAVGGFVANGLAGITTVCTIAVGNTLTFTLGILTAKGGTAGCT